MRMLPRLLSHSNEGSKNGTLPLKFGSSAKDVAKIPKLALHAAVVVVSFALVAMEVAQRKAVAKARAMERNAKVAKATNIGHVIVAMARVCIVTHTAVVAWESAIPESALRARIQGSALRKG
jgi:hypothetical protein